MKPVLLHVGRWRYWIISSELRRNFKTEEWNRQLHKVQLWNLLWVTYRQDLADKDSEAFRAALHALKRGTGRFKGAKAKTESDYEGRSMSAPTGTRGFSSPWGLMTINHLCQQKAFFQFSYQMKARVYVDGELIWLGHIPCEQAKAWSCRENRGVGLPAWDGADKMESVWSSYIMQHCKRGGM